MTVRGRIKGGAVVLESPLDLPEDTEVTVSIVGQEELPTWGEVFKDVIGKAEGLPADFAINHDHYIHGTPKK